MATPALLRAMNLQMKRSEDEQASNHQPVSAYTSKMSAAEEVARFFEKLDQENHTSAISMKAYTGIISVKAKIPKCEYCGKQFPKKGNLEKHISSMHDSPKKNL